MKIPSSSPYAIFNSKEWNSLVSRNDKYENIPIKVQKRYFKAFSFQKIEKSNILLMKGQQHKQMQLIFA